MNEEIEQRFQAIDEQLKELRKEMDTDYINGTMCSCNARVKYKCCKESGFGGKMCFKDLEDTK